GLAAVVEVRSNRVSAAFHRRRRAAAGTATFDDPQGRLSILLFHRFFDTLLPHLLFLSVPHFGAAPVATNSLGSMALFRVQHSAYKKLMTSCKASRFAEYHRNVPSRRTLTSSSFLSLSR